MKKLFTMLFIISFFIIGCSKEEDKTRIVDKRENFMERITLKESSTFIDKNTMNLGVTKIDVLKKEGIIEYKLQSSKDFIFNKKRININNYSFFIKEDKLYLKDNYITYLNGKKYIYIKNIYEGYIDDIKDNSVLNLDFFILNMFLNEITKDVSKKINVVNYTNEIDVKGGCGFWDTYYVYGIGLTESGARAQIRDTIDSGAVNECVALGEIESVPASGGLAWAQAYCCN